MRRLWIFTLILLALSACAAPAEEPEEAPAAPPAQETPEAPAPAEPEKEPPAEEASREDHVLLTLDAPLADGRTLRLEAVGKVEDAYSCGVREVRVYDGEALVQTVAAYEAIEMEWGSAADDLAGAYTNCWSPEEVMEVLDLNFDGSADFGLFGWTPNNTIPYYYWTWDPAAAEYRYACTLQGAEANPETGEVVSEYKSGEAGSQYVDDFYRPDEGGSLYMVRHEVRIFSQVDPRQDTERPVREIWVPRKGAVIRPVVWYDGDLILTRREIPVAEIHEDHTVSRCTEIWELKDGELQLTSREEYTDEHQPE